MELQGRKRSHGVCPCDRLSRLPDDLLAGILGLMPTKDAAATTILSTSFPRAFTRITTLDLDDSSISHCLRSPRQLQRFPLFLRFVDHTLQHHQHVTKFRLRIGGDNTSYCSESAKFHECGRGGHCFPHLDSSRLNTWLSFPLIRCSGGLRELDLCIHVRTTTGACKLPPYIFTCPTLEVLKLDTNLHLPDVSQLCLPNLKLLHLYSIYFAEDGFLARLVSSCHSLEELSVAVGCLWEHGHSCTISSSSLQRLFLRIHPSEIIDDKDWENVTIDTPNLKHLQYDSLLATTYSITNMNALVQAHISIWFGPQHLYAEPSQQIMLSLVSHLSNTSIQDLSLVGISIEYLVYGADITDRLPWFPNLKRLALGYLGDNRRCDKVLWKILSSSPRLETLIFPKGFFISFAYSIDRDEEEMIALEHEFWRTEATPSCCQTHLKRIVIEHYFGMERELNLVKFFLARASVLEELTICRLGNHMYDYDAVPKRDEMSFESSLRMLPRASIMCAIKVHRQGRQVQHVDFDVDHFWSLNAFCPSTF